MAHRIRWGKITGTLILAGAICYGLDALGDFLNSLGKSYSPKMYLQKEGEKYELLEPTRIKLVKNDGNTYLHYNFDDNMVLVDGPGNGDGVLPRTPPIEEAWKKAQTAGCEIAAREMKAAAEFKAKAGADQTTRDDMKKIEGFAARYCRPPEIK